MCGGVREVGDARRCSGEACTRWLTLEVVATPLLQSGSRQHGSSGVATNTCVDHGMLSLLDGSKLINCKLVCDPERFPLAACDLRPARWPRTAHSTAWADLAVAESVTLCALVIALCTPPNEHPRPGAWYQPLAKRRQATTRE